MEYVILALVLVVINFFLIQKRSDFPIHMLQLEGYEAEAYKAWAKENPRKMQRLVYKPATEVKSPLVWTDRARRLKKRHETVNMVLLVLIFVVGLVLYVLNPTLGIVTMIVLNIVLYYLQYRVLEISNTMQVPVEERINMGFYTEAQKKIRTLKGSGLKVLGITGSFGKTSVKFISDTVLSEGLNVKNTPSSYNTPMGLSKVINNELTDAHEVFIAELGAKKKGEIDEVARLVQPNIGIITAIGPTHMHLFKSIDNIMATKYELIENLKEDGVAIFNYDNDYVKLLSDKTTLRKINYGMDDVDQLDVYAKDITVSEKGSAFVLGIRGLGEIHCTSSLLGKHNISNLLAAAGAAYVLGLSLEQIRDGIGKVTPVEHRLNIVDSGNGIIVIDDAFNSNPIGFRAALDVLSNFTTGHKLIITPGMVELGDMEEAENEKIGEAMADVVDYAILVGPKRTEPIVRGLKAAGFSEDAIFVVTTLTEATGVLSHLTQPGDVVLFENDLPDNYSEE
ncbi:UDP-N-acetylmuramoyl-tripeptide--D-alanyl-D-alanine ligase [Peptoniphilus equinus]|uniref:UDP-N-acetylmuramoyl-tripeptide--D-alanyl-D-alanine ligase n=1 Tax=Peptoniphilus equinus TaxID=3016343 RepID=A0ABY7QS44_9FIRM|nr:UDP-N-acetylmuramoyl-tripeptide--D-alanyl-D-alanine ligase [Peptoniphilus equinus]WBW49610.1 UDP-N-acetylmuramoyl-tripeptide--D-alanyl-D-alanine ligase [Peptoniphilus equinus]